MKRPALVALLGAASAAASSAAADDAPLTLTTQPASGPSTNGVVRLDWGPSSDGDRFEVQIAGPRPNASFEAWYQGSDTSSHVSGLDDGLYRFRVRRSNRPAGWSRVAEIRVEHHSISYALSLMAVGAAVFILLVGFVIVSALRAEPTRTRELNA